MSTYIRSEGHSPTTGPPLQQPTPYDGLSASELMQKGICPIKRQFFKAKEQLHVSDDVSATEPKNEDGGKRPQEKSISRNQAKKQLRKTLINANKTEQLCHNYLIGKCGFGDKCKFGHDVQEFLQTKPKDLPGSCPFASLAECPYGIACRYARSHLYDTSELSKQLQEFCSQEDGRAPVAEELLSASEPRFMAFPESAVSSTTDEALPDLPTKVTSTNTDGEQEQLVKLVPFTERTVVPYLPLSPQVEKASNLLPKEAQNKLWKNRYDFAIADSMLSELGCRVSFKRARQDVPPAKGGNAKRSKLPDPEGGDGAPPSGPVQVAVASDPVGDSANASVTASATADAGAQQEKENGTRLLPKETCQEEVMDDAAAESKPTTVGACDPIPLAAAGSDVTPTALVQGKSEAEAEADKVEADAARALYVETLLRPEEKRMVDFRGKTYLAPLTTVGNLPFRRVCKRLGVDITCGEMAMATNLLQGQQSEWALLKRHPCEDVFGAQICGGFPDALARCGQLLDECVDVSFVDVNMGCPIDIVCDKEAGSALLRKPRRIEEIVKSMSRSMDTPMTIKIRRGFSDGVDVAHTLLPQLRSWGAIAATLHGRSRQQRYTKLADWDYVKSCSLACPDLQLLGNGDVMSFTEWNDHLQGSNLAGCMIGRGALVKPWIFTEIKEQRHWDIRSGERLDLLRGFVGAGLEHWGSDSRGVATTRRFLMEWLSFTCRYVPVGLLEVVPQKMNHRPLPFYGRDELETLMARTDDEAWVQIANMLLGPPPAGQDAFVPKHKSNAYAPLEDERAPVSLSGAASPRG